MRKTIALGFLLISTTLCAQNLPYNAHRIDFAPISATGSIHGGFLGHSLTYEYNFRNKVILHAETDQVLFKNLDGRLKYYSDETAHENLLQYGLAIHTPIYFSVPLETGQHEVKIKSVELIGGYHYLRQGRTDEDYWTTDSLNETTVSRVGSIFQSNMCFGFTYHVTKWKDFEGRQKLILQHKYSVEYLYNLGMTTYRYRQNENEVLGGYRDGEQDVTKAGFRMRYRLSWMPRKSCFKLYAGTEIAWFPSINYQYNPKIFVLRGGWMFSPILTNISIGVSWMLHKNTGSYPTASQN